MACSLLKFVLLLHLVAAENRHLRRGYWNVDPTSPTVGLGSSHDEPLNHPSQPVVQTEETGNIERELMRLFNREYSSLSLRLDPPSLTDVHDLHEGRDILPATPSIASDFETTSTHIDRPTNLIGTIINFLSKSVFIR
jgi:hypothetical protein